MSEEEAYEAFVAIHYGETDGEPFCGRCGCLVVYRITRKSRSRGKDAADETKLRRMFKCKSCSYQFSVTSGTIFASRKLEFRDILYAVAEFTNGAKGVSALHLSRLIGSQYKTAFVLAHKLREALNGLQAARLSGEVEIDATYTGGYVKPATRKRHRRDRRMLENQSGKKKCIIVMRERAGRTLAFVSNSERDALPKIIDRLEPGSILYADEATAYNSLNAMFEMRRIDHSKEWAAAGVSTNWAESWNSRFKRAVRGVHHRVAGPHIQNYVGEMVWREDNRRISNGEQFLTMAAAGLHHPISRQWKGYWQRRKAA
jgi:transposase-like protein